MAGDRGHGADEGDTEAEHGDIADVLPQRKAQGHEHAVHHAVKLAVELGVAPGAALEQDVFCPLLGKGDHAEKEQDVVKQVLFREKSAQKRHAHALEKGRDGGGGDAEQHQRDEQAGALLFESVALFYLDKQDDCRDHSRGDQNGIDRVNHFSLLLMVIMGSA